MSQTPFRRATLAGLVLLAIAGTGCVMGPNNGTTTEGSGVGKFFLFQGYYNEPGVTLSLQVLKAPDADPAVTANWLQFATAVSSTSPEYYNSDTPIYYWSVNAAPVPFYFQAARWPAGGVVKVRAVARDPDGDTNLYTFDDVTFGTCFSEQAGKDWATVGIECQGVGLNHSGIVSTKPSPLDLAIPPNYLYRKGDISETETWEYYNHINAPSSLEAFRSRYGFTSSTDITATYYNDGDLGLGREMHCKTYTLVFPYAQVGIACYVSNYGVLNNQPNFGGPPESALQDAVSRQHAFATVAMVYLPPGDFANSVRFMVYGPDGKLQPTAKLDSTGQHVSVPNNCLTCHGIKASYDPATNSVSANAQFLPFDVFSFKYSTAPGFTYAAQADALRRLNHLVSQTKVAPATSAFITGLYSPKAVNDPTAVANDTYVPDAWKGSKQKGRTLYNGVVKPYCRTCHMSSTALGIDFLEEDEFRALAGSIESDVCGPGHEMPQAEHVMRKFWNSGARAYLVTGLGLKTACKP